MSERVEARFEELCKEGEELMARHTVPGVVIGVLYEGNTYSVGFGVTNVDHPLAVTEGTLFQIGSITKTFTATTLMRLAEMGQVDLDATVRTYVPEFKVADEEASARATLRYLLTHTAGWAGDFFRDTGAGDDAGAKYVAEMGDLEQLAPVGQLFSYNNAGFYVAGHVIEVVTGKSYTAAVRELLLEPLNLKNTYFDPGDVITHRFAVGHRVQDRVAHVARPWPLPRAAYPAGGITCSVGDLLQYARFHLGHGELAEGDRLLEAESLFQMQTPQKTIWGEKERIGLAWFVHEVDGTRTLGHGGGTTGQVSHLTIVPQHQFAVAVFTNADTGGSVTRDVVHSALKSYLGLKSDDPKPIESSVEELAAYVGRYARPFAEIELGVLGGRLVGQVTYKGGFPSQHMPPPPSPAPVALARSEPDRLLVVDGPFKGSRIDVICTSSGEIGWLRSGGRLYRRVGST